MRINFSKVLVLFVTSFLLVLIWTSPVIAAPVNLIANPYSVEEGSVTTDWGIELNWEKGTETENSYDIWMSKNGYEWGQPLATVSDTTYVITDKELIKPNTNYYFIVSLAGVSDPYNNPDSSDIAIAFPTRESVHGNYKRNTNSCAKCHRTHSGSIPEDPSDPNNTNVIPLGPKLLIYGTVDDTCKTCHDGTQSKYDVFQGRIETPEYSFLDSTSGPFGDVFNMGIESSPMSIHSVGDSTYTLRSALKDPNQFSDNAAFDKPFGCGSCHVVHAQEYNSETDSYVYLGTNYRMLARKLPADTDVRVLAFAETTTVTGVTYGEKIYYRSGMTEFCVGCHADYYEQGTTVDGQVYEKVTMKNRQPHSINIAPSTYQGGTAPIQTTLPLEGAFNDPLEYNQNKIMCLTCHSAHGSKTYRNTLDEPNFLVRANGQDGICASCHQVN